MCSSMLPRYKSSNNFINTKNHSNSKVKISQLNSVLLLKISEEKTDGEKNTLETPLEKES